MFEFIARVLAFFYSLPVVGGSYGFAIIMLTGAVMIVLMPLTVRATRSTIKMQQVQPQLKELQKKYKDDKTTLNQELMALYSENGINPVGGCLPMVAQLPVFLVLFNVLRGLSRRVSDTHFFTIADQARVQVGGQRLAAETFDPRYLSTDSDMYIDLSQDTEMAFGPFDLSLEALDVLRDNFLTGLPYVVLILFVVGTSFFQQRQVSARRSGGSSMGMNPQQEMILKFLPLLSGIWSFVFPAGLVLYWATSNLFRIGQQGYITRAFYGDQNNSENDQTPASNGESSADDKPADQDEAKSGPSAGSKKQPQPKGANSKSKSKGASTKASANGDSTNGSSDDGSPVDRGEAWAKRRREKATAQAADRHRREQSSRVTPKGTKPSGSKKKRKR